MFTFSCGATKQTPQYPNKNSICRKVIQRFWPFHQGGSLTCMDRGNGLLDAAIWDQIGSLLGKQCLFCCHDWSNIWRIMQVETCSVFRKQCKVFWEPGRMKKEGFKMSYLPGGHVRARYLRGASSFGCVSFMVGYFPDFFLCDYSGFIASGVGVVGCFLTLQCIWPFRKNQNVSDKSYSILQICGSLQSINTFGVAPV